VTKPHVCLVIGPWQLVSLCAALRSRPSLARARYILLVHIPDGHNSLVELTVRLAASLWDWDRILAVDRVLRPKIETTEWPLPVSAWRHAVREVVGETHVKALWISHLSEIYDKLLMETYPRVPVYLYEDGLSTVTWTYIPQRASLGIHDISTWSRLLLRGRLGRHRASIRLSGQRAQASYLARVVTVYTVFEDGWRSLFNSQGTITRQRVPREILFRTVAEARLWYGSHDSTAGRGVAGVNNVLFLGQSLSRYGALSRQCECELYVQAILEVLAKGYHVIWKEHPREENPMFDDLSCLVQSHHFCAFPSTVSFPVECFPGIEYVSACISIFSSSLFYLPLLYEMPCYSIANRFRGAVHHLVFENLIRYTQDRIPDLAELSGYNYEEQGENGY